MRFSTSQIAIVGGVVLIGILILLVLSGVLPGLKGYGQKPGASKGIITFWGIEDEEKTFETAKTSFKATYPGLVIEYTRFESGDDYERALLNALASGKGPDIFMISSPSLATNINKIAPVPETVLNLASLQLLFPQVVESAFVSEGKIYAIPISIDSLALIYNRDLYDAAAAPVPTTWDDFLRIVPKITKVDSAKRITRAASAIGGSNKNIDSATDLLTAIMIQTGTKFLSEKMDFAAFNSEEGEDALNFYAQFSNAGREAYTWNDTMPNSIDAFSDETAASIFNYSSLIPTIRSRNSFINIGVAPFPQPKDAKRLSTLGKFYGLAVSRQSAHADLAWEFVAALTVNTVNAESYLAATGRPPALRTVIDSHLQDPELGIFAKQALIAKIWPEVDRYSASEIFSDMIDSVTSNRTDAITALNEAADKVTALIQRKVF